MHCENCGTKFSNGLCPNCHEEAFILETQYDYLPPVVSDEFRLKAEEQSRQARQQSKAWEAGRVETKGGPCDRP